MSLNMITRLIFIAVFFISPTAIASDFQDDFFRAAIARTRQQVTYDGSYFVIEYQNGDVPSNVGVCTDVIIRSYRAIGTDLQVLVHEDMSAHFSEYPSERIWGLTETDKNIDHRRVPNLQTFFTRHGQSLELSLRKSDYEPGDTVTWMLPDNLPHIGIVTNKYSQESGNPLIVHNIGAGPKLDDMLFSYPITGHYRFVPEKYKQVGRVEAYNQRCRLSTFVLIGY